MGLPWPFSGSKTPPPPPAEGNDGASSGGPTPGTTSATGQTDACPAHCKNPTTEGNGSGNEVRFR